MRSRHLSLAAVAFAAMATPAAAQEPPTWLELENGVSKAQFALAEAIEETVFVETQLDTDSDGARDRVRIRISRPLQTDTQGIDVPVVFEHSPYRGRPGDATNHPVDVDELPQGPVSLDGTLDDFYVPRGYAVVLGESIGTHNSTGCPDVGGPAETAGAKAVIDWLNGRARGFTPEGKTVTADWTTGATGMIGGSYNGTLANQAATTGVDGLKAIVPIAAISSWYDYYRANGLVVAPHSNPGGAGDNEYLGEDTDVLADVIAPRMADRCAHVRRRLLERQDRVTGDWNTFWEARDYLTRADRVSAATFIVHGRNDWNVRTKAFAAWWERLQAPRKLWLHNGGHGGPGGAAYKRAEHRWFDRWLHGVPNGVDSEPAATVQREDGSYADEPDWPAAGARAVAFKLSATSRTAPGTLGAARGGRQREQSFVDRGRELDTDTRLITRPDAADPNRLVYRTPALASAVRLSGTPRVRLRLSIDNRRAANLTAVLVDYGAGGPTMVTRGWLDPQNRAGVARSRPVRPGREYDLRWDLQPDDYVFPAGHRIGLVVVSTDHDYTLRPRPGTRLTLDPARSELRLPLVGGATSMTGDLGG